MKTSHLIACAVAGALLGIRLAMPAPVTAPSQADIELDAFCTSFLANARAVGVTTAAQGADVLRCQRRTYRSKPQ